MWGFYKKKIRLEAYPSPPGNYMHILFSRNEDGKL